VLRRGCQASQAMTATGRTQLRRWQPRKACKNNANREMCCESQRAWHVVVVSSDCGLFCGTCYNCTAATWYYTLSRSSLSEVVSPAGLSCPRSYARHGTRCLQHVVIHSNMQAPNPQQQRLHTGGWRAVAPHSACMQYQQSITSESSAGPKT
jgi:hypothetical protein